MNIYIFGYSVCLFFYFFMKFWLALDSTFSTWFFLQQNTSWESENNNKNQKIEIRLKLTYEKFSFWCVQKVLIMWSSDFALTHLLSSRFSVSFSLTLSIMVHITYAAVKCVTILRCVEILVCSYNESINLHDVDN